MAVAISANKKLKVLCLHGYKQKGEIFKHKLGAFRRSLKNLVDFVFIDAPNLITAPREKCTSSERSWWFCSDDGDVFELLESSAGDNGFRQSVDYVEKILEREGPFDGILGFSQGASFLSLICGLRENHSFSSKFRFVILVSGFKSPNLCHQYLYELPFNVPSLHIIGLDDMTVHCNLSKELLSCFKMPEVIYHEGGHYLPTSTGVKLQYTDFLKKFINTN